MTFTDGCGLECGGAASFRDMALAPPVPVPTLTSSGCCGRASSSSTQEVSCQQDVEDTGLAQSGKAASPQQASLVLAPPPLIRIKHEPPQLVPQQPPPPMQQPLPRQPLQQLREEAETDQDEELKVVIDSKERLRWSPQLHQRFCQAVASLGGCAVAKPKDIVIRMNVPGLTLAHVKSHLQKYRQQEGVTFVAHAPRAPSSGRRQHSMSGGYSGDWEPAAKRARAAVPPYSAAPSPAAVYAVPPAAPMPNMWACQPQPQPAAGPEPLQQFLQVLAGTAAPQQHLQLDGAALALPPPPPPMPAPEQPHFPPAHEQADKLHALADLALAQLDELTGQEGEVQEVAAELQNVQVQLQHAAAAAPTAQQQQAPQQQALQPAQQAEAAGVAGSGADVAIQVSALLAQHQQLATEFRLHKTQQAALMERFASLRCSAQELLALPELAAGAAAAAPPSPVSPPVPAQQPVLLQQLQQQPAVHHQQQQQPLCAVASAALRIVAEHAAATTAAGAQQAPVLTEPLPAAGDPSAGSHLANLIAMVAAAAAANMGGAGMSALPQMPPDQHSLTPLQQLYQLAARHAA